MSHPASTLRSARSVLVVDWPSPDVPESLARAGHEVYVKGGSGPRDFSLRVVHGDQVVSREADPPPERIDLLYVHRPVEELPALAELARALGAQTLWWQSGLAGPETKDPAGCWAPEEVLARVREIAESAGLVCVTGAYIGDVARNGR